MRSGTLAKRLAYSATTIGLILAGASRAFAQGCALCYADAAAAGPRTQAALRHGILTLMIPPMFIFASMFYLLYRRSIPRESFDKQPVTARPSRGGISEVILPLN